MHQKGGWQRGGTAGASGRTGLPPASPRSSILRPTLCFLGVLGFAGPANVLEPIVSCLNSANTIGPLAGPDERPARLRGRGWGADRGEQGKWGSKSPTVTRVRLSR